MAAKLYAVDSGGTTRLIRRWAAVDSGGTTRFLKRAFAVDSGGTARLIYVSMIVTMGDDSESGTSSSHTFSPNASVTVLGGSGTYTYSWSVVSLEGTWSISGSTTSSTAQIQVTGATEVGATYTGEPHCIVTDTLTGFSAEGSALYSYLRN
jgi:hypothetical protein